MSATNQPVEKGEARHEAASPRHEAAPLVTLDDMRAHQTSAAGGKGTEANLHQQGGLNVETASLYPRDQKTGKATSEETQRETSEETKRKVELAQKTSEHVDVLGNPYYHVSGPEQVGQSETKAVTVTDQTKTTQVAANDAPAQQQQAKQPGRPAPDATTDDTTRRA